MAHLPGYAPMLVDERPLDLDEPGWLYELKYDGYRCVAEADGAATKLRSKTGSDMTRWFPEVTRALALLGDGPHVLDGEVCVLDDLGRSDYDKLHTRALHRRWYSGADPVAFCAFDLLMHKGKDITQQTLLQRKALLAKLLKKPLPNVLLVGHFESDGRLLFNEAVMQLKLEGLVAKRTTSPYRPGIRSSDWVKVKRKGAVPAQRFKRRP